MVCSAPIKLPSCLLMDDEKRNHLQQDLLQRFADVFDGDVSLPVRDFQVHVEVTPEAASIFKRFYKIPYSLEKKVKESLDVLVAQNILVPVEYSAWATPLVVVPKRQGEEVRLCADFKVTINKVLDHMFYPPPTLQIILDKLRGAKT